jgi:type II secretory pathway pseudopilin PulG
MHTRGRPGAIDAGETLIELIMAVAIMGIAVVAIVGGIATSILMSDIHRKEASAGAYVRNYAEAIAGHYNASALLSSYAPSAAIGFVLDPATTGFTAAVTSVKCWDDTVSAFGTCSGGSPVQQVTLSVASNDLRASESLVVVVRQP